MITTKGLWERMASLNSSTPITLVKFWEKFWENFVDRPAMESPSCRKFLYTGTFWLWRNNCSWVPQASRGLTTRAVPLRHQKTGTCHYHCLRSQTCTGIPGVILESAPLQKHDKKSYQKRDISKESSSWGFHFTSNQWTLSPDQIQGQIGLSIQPTFKVDFPNINLTLIQKKNRKQSN